MKRAIMLMLVVAIPLSAQSPLAGRGVGVPVSTVTKESLGGARDAREAALQVMLGIKAVCQMIENDGKLFAVCDNTKPEAIAPGSTHLPQAFNEWEAFAGKVWDTDAAINGKRRAIVVINGGDVIAEVSAGGTVSLKKK